MPIDAGGGAGTAAAARVRFLGLDFDQLAMPALLDAVDRLARRDDFSYVVTPNVDHLVRLHDAGNGAGNGDALWRCYHDAALCICDSRVLSAIAALRGRRLPAVPGSDLVARLLLERVRDGDAVTLVGGTPDTLDHLRQLFPRAVFRHHIPPMGLRHDEAALAAAVDFIVAHPAKWVLLAVGSPQQELLAHRVASSGGASGVGLCIGASVDFIVGDERRAPRPMQAAGLEWLFRLTINPKRLWRRYLVEGPRIFLLAARWRPADDVARSERGPWTS